VKIIRKCIVYPMACLLLKLSSQFNVTIATVGKSFSTMNFVKNQLRDHMRDEFFNDCRVIYMESDFFFFFERMESDIFDSGKYEKYLTTNSKYEVTHRAINIVIL